MTERCTLFDSITRATYRTMLVPKRQLTRPLTMTRRRLPDNSNGVTYPSRFVGERLSGTLGASAKERDMASRDGALARALTYFDSGGFRDHLAELVAIPSTSQDPGHEAEVQRYLADAIQPWLERMGFSVEIHLNPIMGFGPILFAERLEGPDRPTILSYGHGDTVRGLDDQWRAGLSPWTLTEEGDRCYGRGPPTTKVSTH